MSITVTGPTCVRCARSRPLGESGLCSECTLGHEELLKLLTALQEEREEILRQNAVLQEERDSAYANSKSSSQDLCDLSTENRRLRDLLHSERKHREDWSKVIPESDLGLVLELCKRRALFDRLRDALSASAIQAADGKVAG